MSLHTNKYTTCAKLVGEKKVFVISSQAHLTHIEKYPVRYKVDFFLMKKGKHIMNQKQLKQVYVNDFFYILYSICVLPKITKIK